MKVCNNPSDDLIEFITILTLGNWLVSSFLNFTFWSWICTWIVTSIKRKASGETKEISDFAMVCVALVWLLSLEYECLKNLFSYDLRLIDSEFTHHNVTLKNFKPIELETVQFKSDSFTTFLPEGDANIDMTSANKCNYFNRKLLNS